MTDLPFNLNLVEIDRIRILATETMTREVKDWFGVEGISLIPNISPALVRHIAGALELVLAEKKSDDNTEPDDLAAALDKLGI